MKRNKTLTKYSYPQSVDSLSSGKVLFALLLILILFSACAGKMSVEEARKVTVSMSGEAFVPPPRHIDDILVVLSGADKFDSQIAATYRTAADRPTPGKGNEATFVNFYLKRGWAAFHILRWDQTLQDLRTALEYDEKAGIKNQELQNKLAGLEMYAGNYKRSIEIHENIKEKSCATYWLLVAGYTHAGDFELAQKYKSYGIAHCGQSITDKKFIAKMRAHGLEAQGKYNEAENQWGYNKELADELKAKAPHYSTSSRALRSNNLMQQNRLVEAEIEIRDALKASIELGGTESGTSGRIIAVMGEIIEGQGRLQDAEKLARTGIRILKSSGISMDSFAMVSNRMALGNILADQEKYSKAMQEYDLAKETLEKNQYFFEKLFGRNPSLILTLLQAERTEEALELISAVYKLYYRNFGKNNYLTAEMLGLRGMAHFKMKNIAQAAEDFSEAVSILLASNMVQEGDYSSKQRLKILLETYIDLLNQIYKTVLEKELNIDAPAEAFRLSDAIRGHVVQHALGASGARIAAVEPELADLVRKEQDASHQIKALKALLTDILATPEDQRSPQAINDLGGKIDRLSNAREALLDEIKKRFPKYADFTNPRPATLPLTQKHLRPGDLDGLDQPALALSSPSISGDKEDGLLTMGEILRLKLNADWVVLSACNTGAAEGKGAEAVSGLGRAFFYAGTRAILVSMWPVEITSARKLTVRLFQHQKVR